MAEEKPKLKLIGEDGNVFSILARAKKSAKNAGWTVEKFTEFMEKAMAGDYDHCLRMCQEHFDVS